MKNQQRIQKTMSQRHHSVQARRRNWYRNNLRKGWNQDIFHQKRRARSVILVKINILNMMRIRSQWLSQIKHIYNLISRNQNLNKKYNKKKTMTKNKMKRNKIQKLKIKIFKNFSHLHAMFLSHKTSNNKQ